MTQLLGQHVYECAKTQIWVVDGQLVHERDLPAGLTLSSLGDVRVFSKIASSHDNPLVAFNTANTQRVLCMDVAPHTQVTGPVQVIFVSTQDEVQCARPFRFLLKAGSGASLELIETHLILDDEPKLSTAVTEIVLGENSKFEHVREVTGGQLSSHYGHNAVRLGEGSSYRLFNTVWSGKWVRSEINPQLTGKGASCELSIIDFADGTRQVENITLVDHQVIETKSHQTVKGIFSGSSIGVFDGQVLVREGADKTDALQMNRNLLLSPDATAYARPQLEIYADDVKCAHGATIGQLDENHLFYLRARGLSEQEAKAMLTWAFAKEVIENITNESLREQISVRFQARGSL